MAAPVTFLVGRAGSGKSRLIRQIIAGCAARGERVALIVPEQFTFETERELAASLPGGLLYASVFSFTSLARRVLKETGERSVFLSRQGRRMVIRKAADEAAGSLAAFGSVYERSGFAEQCDAFFTECKRFNISPESLREAAAQLKEGTLFSKKLSDLALLYGETERYLAGRSMDAADTFRALSERLPRSFLAGQTVIIDGFDLISEQLYDVLGALMETAGSLTVALRADLSPLCRDREVFRAERKLLTRLRNMAAEKGAETKTLHLPAAGAHEDAAKRAHPALRHLEREAFTPQPRPYEGSDAADALALFAATSRAAEAEAVADAILAAAKRGVRYRDMAVIATELDAYINPVKRALRARDIPFFTDAKHPLAGYAAARLLVSALLAASRAFRQKDITELLKTGLTGVSRDDAEQFEVYIRRMGIRGNGFLKPFEKGDVPEGAERARRQLAEPLAALKAALQSARSAKEKTEAVYAYLTALDVRRKLTDEAETLRAAGQFEHMEECAQVYNMLMELFSQLHAILGDAPISTERYIAVLQEGLSTYEVGVIPTTADQVLFGSLGRTRARSVRALFVLGAVEGLFPAFARDDSMIDDTELSSLSAMGLPALPSSRERTEKELSDVYGAVAKPSEYLYLSYPLGGGGETAVPCRLVDTVKAMFPGVKEGTDLMPLPPVSAESGFKRLVEGLRSGVDSGVFSAETAALYGAYREEAAYAEPLRAAEAALFHTSSPEPFGRELAAALYGAPLYGSVTRLETFNACPFKHFARYGLKLNPPLEYKERRADEGTFCHEALSLFTERLIALGRPAKHITKEDVAQILDGILPTLLQTHNNGVLLDTARMRALAARLIRRIRETAHAIVLQLANSRFLPTGTEVEFGRGKTFPPIELQLSGGRRCLLSGKIDRLDTFRDAAGETFLRIIDYKTGSADFSYTDLYYGLKLQLPLYLVAATAADAAAAKVCGAGFYYLPVRTAAVKAGTAKEDLLKEAMKTFRMKGISLKEGELLEMQGGDTVLPQKGNGVLGRGEFAAVTDYAKRKAKRTAEAIAGGHAETAPYRRNKQDTACGNCDYAGLCAFDPAFRDCRYRGIRSMKAEAFFEEAAHDKMDE